VDSTGFPAPDPSKSRSRRFGTGTTRDLPFVPHPSPSCLASSTLARREAGFVKLLLWTFAAVRKPSPLARQSPKTREHAAREPEQMKGSPVAGETSLGDQKAVRVAIVFGGDRSASLGTSSSPPFHLVWCGGPVKLLLWTFGSGRVRIEAPRLRPHPHKPRTLRPRSGEAGHLKKQGMASGPLAGLS